MIDVQNISKILYAPHEVRALVNVSTKVEAGEVLVVIGPSGSGKSTFLRCLNQLETADAGHIYIDGIDILDHKTDINKVREEVVPRLEGYAVRAAVQLHQAVTHDLFALEGEEGQSRSRAIVQIHLHALPDFQVLGIRQEAQLHPILVTRDKDVPLPRDGIAKSIVPLDA